MSGGFPVLATEVVSKRLNLPYRRVWNAAIFQLPQPGRFQSGFPANLCKNRVATAKLRQDVIEDVCIHAEIISKF
jgi:hypothetical protein